MTPREIVLLVIDSYGGTISGKTLLQKVVYFTDDALGLGLGFKAHHYGPYSAMVEEAVGELKGLGFVEEHSIGFGVTSTSGFGEVRRHDYRLTDDGKEVLQDVRTRNPAECRAVSSIVQRIRQNGDPNYLELSIAAKSYFLLKKQEKPLTNSELKKEAQKFGWSLSPEALENALQLLNRLDLVG